MKGDDLFASQAEPLAEVRTPQQYADWMQGLRKMMLEGRYAPKLLPPTVSATTSRPTQVFKGTHTGERDSRLPARAHKPSLPSELPLMRQLAQVPTGSLDVWPKIFHSSVQSAAVKTTVSAAGLRHANSTACWISCPTDLCHTPLA